MAIRSIAIHKKVNVPANSWNTPSGFIDTLGYDRLAITASSDASHLIRANIRWSHDGVTWQGEDVDVVNATRQNIAGITETKARYAMISLHNGDSGSAHVISSWMYLKQ